MYNKSMKTQIKYLNSGYIDFEDLLASDGSAFKILVGARGIGKTFGILKYMLDHDINFIFMRRTQTQVDMVRTDELNPFKSIEMVCGPEYQIVMKPINKNMSAIYRTYEVEGEPERIPDEDPTGYMTALSTISNIRGFDASDIDYLIYDEFIGEKHEKPIRAEGLAFLNAVETIGRNRELSGRRPLQVILMSNSTNLANPIFVELKLITPLEKAFKRGQHVVRIPERNISIYNITDSPISQKKAQTVLYQLTGTDSDFAGMALDNSFNKEYTGLVKSQNLKEYKLEVVVGEICIYRHKSARRWYVSEHRSGKPIDTYDSSEIELKRFQHDYYHLKLWYLNRKIFFESYIQQVLFEQYIHI